MLSSKFFYLLTHIAQLPRFIKEYLAFRRESPNWDCRFRDLLPMFQDATSNMDFDAHTVYYTGWAVRVMKEVAPLSHVDISSSIIFCSIASAFIPIKHYDYRTPILQMTGLECGSQDLCNLSFSDNSIKSLSCMHVIEHVGLGRYGDPIDPAGDQIAARELKRVLAPGGTLLIVVPLAERPRVRFNGHRIYSLEKVMALFTGLKLIEFSFLNDSQSNRFTRFANQSNVIGSDYGCGCFIFGKD